MTATCPSCAKSTPSHLALCVFCGKAVHASATCRSCGRQVGAMASQCLYCNTPVGQGAGAPSPAPPPAAAPAKPPAKDLAPDVAAFGREVAREQHRREKARWMLRGFELFLFVLAVPVLVPVLLLLVFQTKRWGRIPMTFILIDGGILFLIGLGTDFRGGTSTFLGMSAFTWLMFLGLGSALLLNLIRSGQGKAQQGILMGFSGLVVTLLIFGGGAILGGLLAMSWKKPDAAGGPEIPESATTLGPEDALNLAGPGPHHVRLKNAILDADKPVWRLEPGVGGFLFQEPTQPLIAQTVDALQAQQAERLGSVVYLAARTRTWKADWSPASALDAKGPGRATLKSGSFRLISRKLPAPTKEKLFDPEGNYGVLLRGDDASLALHVGAMPSSQSATWCFPVQGSGGELWVSTLKAVPDTSIPEPQGILEILPPDRSAALSAHVRKSMNPAFAGTPRLLVAASPDEYRRLRDLEPPQPAPSNTGSFIALGIGSLLLAGAAVLAFAES